MLNVHRRTGTVDWAGSNSVDHFGHSTGTHVGSKHRLATLRHPLLLLLLGVVLERDGFLPGRQQAVVVPIHGLLRGGGHVVRRQPLCFGQPAGARGTMLTMVARLRCNPCLHKENTH